GTLIPMCMNFEHLNKLNYTIKSLKINLEQLDEKISVAIASFSYR
ncbi:hypothetical protein LCGC14_0576360, partial [marine sediment metagenome]